MDIKNLPLHYLVQREIFFNDRALFYVNEFLGLFFFCFRKFRQCNVQHAVFYMGTNLFLIDIVGRIMVCWNLVYENSRRK